MKKLRLVPAPVFGPEVDDIRALYASLPYVRKPDARVTLLSHPNHARLGYAYWFHQLSGPEARRTIDRIIAKEKPFTVEPRTPG